jgi:vancomycin resistance protein YoaR
VRQGSLNTDGYNRSVTSVSYPARRKVPILAQAIAALAAGLLLFLGAVATWVVAYQLIYAGRVFPGISVAGVDLSGLSPDQAAVKLNQTLSYPIAGKVVLRDGDKVWVASPAQLGMVFDASSSADAAYRAGRGPDLFGALDGQVRARSFGYDVAPVIIFDQRVAYQYLQGIAQQVDQPVVEASLRVDGANVESQAGQAGRKINVDATLIYVSAVLQSFRDGEIPLVVQGLAPTIMDASAQAEAARQMLSQPLVLEMPSAHEGDPGPWVYDVPVVAKLIGVHKVQNGDKTELQLALDPNALRKMLKDLEPQIDRQAQNSRFHFNEATGQLVALTQSVTGRQLDVDASVKAIIDALLSGQHSVPVVVHEIQPKVPQTATAEELGIKGLLPNGQQTSYFRGSHEERIQNIQTAAARFDGVLVAPGETFSMGEALGDITLDNGYAEALIIYGDSTIKGVGGGVCQVSTTLFRTVFWAGFPVVERIPHAYRVSYYEETSGGVNPDLAGLDATVYFPLVDFKFQNDSPYWILMETTVDVSSRSLTWKFYSTYDGRTVEWQTSGPQNVVPAPKPVFKVNPDLHPGQMTQTDYAANGADIDVQRTVNKDGGVYFQDEFKTHYEAWQAVCEYARGVNDPEKQAKRQDLCQPPPL